MSAETLTEKTMTLERPHPALRTYYIICAILTGPAIVGTLPYLLFRYYTLRYRFDAEGIHMRVGLLFRREVNLTYARIQDIHLRSGIIQRWLGLANLQVQTASGSAGPELVIEGFKEFESIRDFLYTRMRGYQARNLPSLGPAALPADPPAPGPGEAAAAPAASVPAAGGNTEVVALLLGIRDELRRARELLEARSATAPAPPRHV